MNSFEQCKNEVIYYSKLSYDRGLVTAAGGNVSARFEDKVVITASGISLRDISEENLIICDINGEVLGCPCPGLKPSKETVLHLRIYKAKPNVDSIIHVHPPYSTGYSVHGCSVPIVTASAQMKIKHVPMVPQFNPGTQDLADFVEKTVRESEDYIKCVLLQNHGIIAYEHGLSECFDIAELVEDTAHIAFISDCLNLTQRT